MQVTFSESVNVKEVFCSDTSTMFLTDVGVVWACGSNKYNKLGLNQRQGFLAALKQVFNKTEVEGAKEPVIVRDLCRFIVTSISMGEHHTAVVIEGGKVITFGRNIEGQLGSGDSKPQQGLVHVKSLSDVVSLQVGCSPMSTIVSISNNSQIILLGSRYKTSPVTDTYNWLDPSVKRQYSTELNRSRQGSAGSADRSLTQISLSNSALREGVTPDGLGGSTSSSKKGDVEVDSETSTSGRQSATQRQLSGSSNRASSAVSTTKLPADDVEIHYQPVPVLNLQSEQSETVTLAGFTCHQENIFVLVETTAPPTQKKLKKRKSDQRNMTSYTNFKSSASSREAGDELSNSEMSEMDTLGATPSWIQRELADADYISAVSKKTPNDLEEFTYNVNSEKSVISKPPQPPLKTAKAKVKPSGTATVFKTGLRREDNYETGQLESTTDDDVVDDYELSNGHDRSALPTTKHEAWISSTNLPVAPVKSEGKPKNSKSKKAAAIEPSRNQRELNREAELQLEIEKLRKEAEASQMSNKISIGLLT
ncbi:hypothetical protein EB796_020093 [Bugula neritina]|uniref:non-specific serine/threonine protein kinase n=1 Tax=Bugula neritina TaxID=10212 RepID=A0A7J7J6P9_BUGNE|nr:hypothetical protein EB796_020093 [Bugula neritina]